MVTNEERGIIQKGLPDRRPVKSNPFPQARLPKKVQEQLQPGYHVYMYSSFENRIVPADECEDKKQGCIKGYNSYTLYDEKDNWVPIYDENENRSFEFIEQTEEKVPYGFVTQPEKPVASVKVESAADEFTRVQRGISERGLKQKPKRIKRPTRKRTTPPKALNLDDAIESTYANYYDKINKSVLSDEIFYEELDENQFYAELGISKSDFLNDALWHRWIDNYKKYRDTLNKRNKRSLGYHHWMINRLYFMLIEGRHIDLMEAFKEKKEFRKNYKIPYPQRVSEESFVWLVIAGAYVEGIRRKKYQKQIDKKIDRFYQRIPQEWLKEIVHKNRADQSPYEKFLSDLSKHWHKFLWSYENESHIASINNWPQIGSLQTFLDGESPSGQRVAPTDKDIHWPKHIISYALNDSGARLLFEQQVHEYKLFLNPGGASGYSIHETKKHIPFWMSLGMD